MPGQSPGPMSSRDASDLGKGRGTRDREEIREGGEEKHLDQQLWQACAGSMVQLPTVGSKIIYFPQGHAEQAASSPDFPRALGPAGTVPCRVLSVKFLADKETDEVFASLRLHPESGSDEDNDRAAAPSPSPEKPASFAKTLTQSDANNGGGFSVPRYCAETIFPRLDYSVDPPVQTVLAKDVHGEVWKFRHIYRGTPRRHLLTTGWSTFVNHKKLVAGDAIVFLRSNSGELCVGVRRSMRGGGSGNADALLWHSASSRSSSRWELRPPMDTGLSDGTLMRENGSSRSAGGGAGNGGGSFTRNRAKVTAKSVLDAATLAASGKAFEVVYYPRASTAEFCVRAQTVRAALSHGWYAGMRFKMAFETEDSSRISWFMGTISAVQAADPILWPSSPWRVLQVAWDEPDLLQGVSRVSPWQVELVSTLPMQLPPFSLPRKRFRQTPAPEGQSFSGLPTTTFANGVLGQANPWHGLSDDVPAGMQGARHERLYGLTFSECQPNRIHSGLLENRYQAQDIPVAATLGYGATDLRLGNVFPQGGSGGGEQRTLVTTVLCNGSQNDSGVSCTESSCNKQGTFLLFGKKIETARVQEQQNSAGSSSEATSRHNVPSQQPSASSSGDSHNDAVQQNVLLHENGDSGHGGDVGGSKWLKKQASVLSSEKKDRLEGSSSDEESSQCRVFMESGDVKRTLDLSSFGSYDELYKQLAAVFCVDVAKISGRVVYKDSEGSTIHTGGEPYANFVKSVRRLTILADTQDS
ncbi:auxin response factor 10 [Selaginella moellendorffii]|uniref:auxin response factor 10 n=1 Tax=Selaginella moellendorffii TaxID=88036 RepID=UPI000D1C36DC|nr:auxin response factor 10 [Selaginella moellendorffii]|eukprot:XP_024541392.1 auxin response factor 10 [Selaginella moellendorffii]